MPMSSFPNRAAGSISEGFFLAVVLHLLLQPLLYYLFLKATGRDWSTYFGFTQFVYVIPTLLICWLNRKTLTFIGLVIASALTFMLNDICGFGARFNH